MGETNYPGIDYSGPGSQANRDSETQIRYGIISQHGVMPEALDDIFSRGTDLELENAEGELKSKLRGVLEDYFSDSKRGAKGDGTNNGTSRLDVAVEDCFAALDGWADNIESSACYRLEEDGLVLQTDNGNDLWVIKSQFYTYAQFCSPCAPGACHLANPLSVKIQAGIASIADTNDGDGETFVNSNKCYCLPHDWFEGGKAPYRVFRVDNNEEVLP